jgi:hypothetical protein
MTKGSNINIFQQRCVKTTTFPNWFFFLIEPERGPVVHLVVGIHVADVVVSDQGHVTLSHNKTLTTCRKSKPPPRGVTCFISLNNKDRVWTDLYHRYSTVQTGVRMPLTSLVKELGGILQKLIKIDHFINLEYIPIEKWDKTMDSLAMRIDFLTKSWARGNERKRKWSHKI